MLVRWERKFTLKSSQNLSETKLQGVSFKLDVGIKNELKTTLYARA